MSQTKHQIQELLLSAGAEPRHRFGQNFMIDRNLVRTVADAGEITADDCVIEVGPGTGTLTEELLERAGKVIAVEIDRDLSSLLRERFGANEKFELIEGDALASKHQLNAALIAAIAAGPCLGGGGGTFKLIANLPYNIASPLVIELLIAGVDLLAFTVQKEVADRLRAAAGSDAYGPLSVTAQMLSQVELLRTLPPQAFWPEPKIESALVRMRRVDRITGNIGGRAADFGRFVQKVFASRRKTLRKGLQQAGYTPELILSPLKIDPQLRPEELSPPQFAAMFELAESASPKE